MLSRSEAVLLANRILMSDGRYNADTGSKLRCDTHFRAPDVSTDSNCRAADIRNVELAIDVADLVALDAGEPLWRETRNVCGLYAYCDLGPCCDVCRQLDSAGDGSRGFDAGKEGIVDTTLRRDH